MKAKLTKEQVFKNAERDYLNYKRTYADIVESHKRFRAEYGVSEAETNFKRKEESARMRLGDLKRKMDKAKLDLI